MRPQTCLASGHWPVLAERQPYRRPDVVHALKGGLTFYIIRSAGVRQQRLPDVRRICTGHTAMLAPADLHEQHAAGEGHQCLPVQPTVMTLCCA